MTYTEALRYLESFINYENIPAWPYKQSLKLQRFRDFLVELGNPQYRLRCIHVAGTKGKGSTSVFIAHILRAAGFKVGLYTSPHLTDFRERIRILDKNSYHKTAAPDFEGMIPRRDLTCLIKVVKPYITRFNRKSKYGYLSFFEVYTALAFLYFKEKKADFAVLETGLGGRLDATNTVRPLVCAITPISYEHTQKLGKTLKEIAAEKAGIIKKNSQQDLIVINAPQEPEVAGVIRRRCKKIRAKLYQVGKDIRYSNKNNRLEIRGLCGDYRNLKIKLIGGHQAINAAVAVGAAEGLRFHNIRVNSKSIRRGLSSTVWPGRCEVIGRRPDVVIDGAQNKASAKVLKEAIRSNFKYRRLILVLGISNDKDIIGISGELHNLADKVILTRANNPRATLPRDLASYFMDKELFITDNVQEAKKQALALAGGKDLILVCGSLFVTGEFRNDAL